MGWRAGWGGLSRGPPVCARNETDTASEALAAREAPVVPADGRDGRWGLVGLEKWDRGREKTETFE